MSCAVSLIEPGGTTLPSHPHQWDEQDGVSVLFGGFSLQGGHLFSFA
jgi:hypothetical protein